MKKIVITFFALCIMAKSFSQTSPDPIISKDYYLQKSKTNKTTARILLGTGIGMTIGGAAINLGQPWNLLSDKSSNSNKGMGLFYTGIVTTLSSIPFYISAHQNKKRAVMLTVQNRNVPYQNMNGISSKTQAELVLKIGL